MREVKTKKKKQIPLKDFGRIGFTSFCRKHHITYRLVNHAKGKIVCVLSGPFPRLNLLFEEESEYITVWRIGLQGYIDGEGRFKECSFSYSFPDTDPYRLIKKLLERRVIKPQEVCRIKF